MSKYVLVDLSNLFARAKYGFKADTVTKAGMCIQMIFRTIKNLHYNTQFDHLVICTDQGSWRTSVYPEYKSARKADKELASFKDKEEDEYLYEVLGNVIEYFQTKTHTTVLRSPGIEADDLIARWIALHPNDEHIILSSDSDFIQLLAPNVKILDGMKEIWLSIEGVTDLFGNRHRFIVNTSTGKIQVKEKDPDFIPESEWWREALFIKIIRGDSSDSVFSAYPGVRYTSKKVGIKQAWDDRKEKGFAWNNFMLQEWSKMKSSKGEMLTETVKVGDEYKRNVMLIDLTAQPDWAKEKIDNAIKESIKNDTISMMGIHFLKFCGANDLPTLGHEHADHTVYLKLAYPGGLHV